MDKITLPKDVQQVTALALMLAVIIYNIFTLLVAYALDFLTDLSTLGCVGLAVAVSCVVAVLNGIMAYVNIGKHDWVV